MGFSVTKTGSKRVIALQLEDCIRSRDLESGKELHKKLKAAGLDREADVGSLLVQMYGRSNSPTEARGAFERIQEKSTSTWNHMIAAYARNGCLTNAREMFESIPCKSCSSWTTIIRAYVRNRDLDMAMRLFGAMPRRNLFSWNTILAGYAQCGPLRAARELFSRIPLHDVYTWDTMISAFVKLEGDLDEAKGLFEAVPEHNIVSWDSLIAGYAQRGSLDIAKHLFGRIPQWSLLSWTSVLAGYTRSGLLIQAKNVFDEMPEWDDFVVSNMFAAYNRHGLRDQAESLSNKLSGRNSRTSTVMIDAYSRDGNFEAAAEVYNRLSEPDLVAQTAMLAAYVRGGDLHQARKLFDSMGVRDTVAWITMIGAHALHGSILDARDTFNQMPKRDVVAWSSMIAAYSQNSEASEALALFRLMDLEGFTPDKVTFISAAAACQHKDFLREGQLIHREAEHSGFTSDSSVATSLLNMYGKHGRIEDAELLFVNLSELNLVSCNAMVVAYAQNGHNQEALELFHVMILDGLQPNEVTFVEILAACSHAGWIRKGLMLFASMPVDFETQAGAPHYSCVVDLLGRSGQLDEAEELVYTMPYEPSNTTWMSLSSACKLHNEHNKEARVSAAYSRAHCGLSTVEVGERNSEDEPCQNKVPQHNDCELVHSYHFSW